MDIEQDDIKFIGSNPVQKCQIYTLEVKDY